MSPYHTVSFRSLKCCTSGQLFCSAFVFCFNLRNTMSLCSDHFLLTDHFPSWLECSEPKNVACFSQTHRLYYKHAVDFEP